MTLNEDCTSPEWITYGDLLEEDVLRRLQGVRHEHQVAGNVSHCVNMYAIGDHFGLILGMSSTRTTVVLALYPGPLGTRLQWSVSEEDNLILTHSEH